MILPPGNVIARLSPRAARECLERIVDLFLDTPTGDPDAVRMFLLNVGETLNLHGITDTQSEDDIDRI